MKRNVIWLVLVVFTAASCASLDIKGHALTTPRVEALVARVNELSCAGDLREYAKLLSEDLIVTLRDSQDTSMPPEQWNKPQYLAAIKESYERLPVASAVMTIEEINISDDGQQAEVRGVGRQTSVPDAEGNVIRMTVKEVWKIAIRDGRPVVTEVHGVLMNYAFEQTPERIN
jgi:ketosteroid isomerase-like protein